jgi:hypothetical protein
MLAACSIFEEILNFSELAVFKLKQNFKNNLYKMSRNLRAETFRTLCDLLKDIKLKLYEITYEAFFPILLD